MKYAVISIFLVLSGISSAFANQKLAQLYVDQYRNKQEIDLINQKADVLRKQLDELLKERDKLLAKRLLTGKDVTDLIGSLTAGDLPSTCEVRVHSEKGLVLDVKDQLGDNDHNHKWFTSEDQSVLSAPKSSMISLTFTTNDLLDLNANLYRPLPDDDWALASWFNLQITPHGDVSYSSIAVSTPELRYGKPDYWLSHNSCGSWQK